MYSHICCVLGTQWCWSSHVIYRHSGAEGVTWSMDTVGLKKSCDCGTKKVQRKKYVLDYIFISTHFPFTVFNLNLNAFVGVEIQLWKYRHNYWLYETLVHCGPHCGMLWVSTVWMEVPHYLENFLWNIVITYWL